MRCALLPTQDDETAWLADSLAHLVRTGTPPGEIAVLCRTAAHFAEIHAALVARDVPVEVVGLSGLLHLPEVADLVAVCEVLHDPTANASLVRVLTGPRWRIGPRDLALLGRRARLLVRYGPGAHAEGADRLAAAVEGVDPAEVVSLADALETFLDADPGDDLPFSPEARVRFARLAAEIRDLRRALADPLMDVLHRVLAVTGLEVELAASPHALAARRRETLHAFLDIAAGFASLDGEVTLLAFLGFLHTAAQYEKGLDSSLPGGENTVKVLTAHKSKGLEWDVVAVPGLVAKGFPSERGRELWPANAKVLPHGLRGDAATLPDVAEWTRAGLDGFRDAMKEHQRIEELRLGYVTFTRPRSLLLGSGHWWGPTQKKPFGPSAFLDALREHCEAGHGEIEAWAEPPEPDAQNPSLAESPELPWPLPLDPTALAWRRQAAKSVLAHVDEDGGPGDPEGDGEPGGSDRTGAFDGHGGSDGLVPEETRLVASWDRDLDALTGELRRARATVRDVPLPVSLTATQLMRLAADPDGLARDLARPLPRPPAARRAPGHTVPRLGRVALRRTTAVRPGRPAGHRSGRRERHRRRGGSRGAQGRVPPYAVRGPAAVPGRGGLPPHARRAAHPGADRRGLPGRRHLRDPRLEDRAPGVHHLWRGPAPTGHLPAGLGRAAGRPAERRPGRLPVRPHGRHRPPPRPPGPRGTGTPAERRDGGELSVPQLTSRGRRAHSNAARREGLGCKP